MNNELAKQYQQGYAITYDICVCDSRIANNEPSASSANRELALELAKRASGWIRVFQITTNAATNTASLRIIYDSKEN